MRRLPLRLRVYLLLVPAFGAVLFLLTLQLWGRAAWLQPQAALALLFFALTALALSFPILLQPASKAGSKFSVATAAVYASLLLLGTPLAIVVVATAQALADLRLRRRWYNSLFNAGQSAVALALAGLVFFNLEPRRLPASPDSARAIVALALTAIMMYLANSWLVVLASALHAGRNPIRLWLQQRRWSILQEVALYLLGLLALVAARASLWSVLLLIVPVIAVYWSMRRTLLGADESYQLLRDLCEAVESRYNPGHGERVAKLAAELARRLGMAREQIETVRLAARIHDIGQLNFEAGQLPAGTEQPAEAIVRHVEVGKRLAERIPRYRFAAPLILHHHEHYDGAGLPLGLRGEEIPLGARLIAVADAWDAIVAASAGEQQAQASLRALAGSRLDPRVVACLLEIAAEPAPKQ